jgi:hypothetical protein
VNKAANGSIKKGRIFGVDIAFPKDVCVSCSPSKAASVGVGRLRVTGVAIKLRNFRLVRIEAANGVDDEVSPYHISGMGKGVHGGR